VVYPLMAGYSPMYTLAQSKGIPAFSAGIGYPGMNIHAPNENIRPRDYYEIIRFVGELVQQFAAV
jgi:succinyl-diaminopimelate desuccinylase